jgi:agmatine deiminase
MSQSIQSTRGVVVPVFDDPYDQAALQLIQSLFPERKVVGVNDREILLGGGNIHCITQQQLE